MTDHANLKWLTSISLNKQNWLDGACQWQNMTFKLDVDKGQNYTLSGAPLSCPSDEIEALIVPPEEVTTFLITAICFDIPTH